MHSYEAAEAARRRACPRHGGSLGPYCVQCHERERDRREVSELVDTVQEDMIEEQDARALQFFNERHISRGNT